MHSRVFKVNQTVKIAKTGELVNVVEVIPIGMAIFYRVETEAGERLVLPDVKLRKMNEWTNKGYTKH